MSTMRHAVVANGRGLEWLTSLILLGLAAALATPGDTLSMSVSYSGFIAAGFTETIFIVLLLIVAAERLFGLWRNGHWRRSPILRFIGAIVGAAIFAGLAAGFAWPWIAAISITTDPLTVSFGLPMSTGVPVYALLAWADLQAAYRSGADIRVCRSLQWAG
ncbi:hypothetical protein [Tropicimonas sp. IMCC34011]|uniref:hypothetical protein n=1 Tax=Tropicimonas sp. IMCC34011 TaxID=2248759 RepID=UPI000E252CC1|nr:hypothetical protein [Tropicimonas sp. IMCC34011]